MTGVFTLTLPSDRVWTWEDLQAIPDEAHHHYELIEGQILVSPSPGLRHQRCVGALFSLLRAAAAPELEVVVSPFDYAPEIGTVLQPDVLVIRRGSTEANRIVVPPVLVIEVLSPRTRTTDQATKRELYARFGVPQYWIIDPDEHSIVALLLSPDGRYADAEPVSDLSAIEPVPVSFAVADLVRD